MTVGQRTLVRRSGRTDVGNLFDNCNFARARVLAEGCWTFNIIYTESVSLEVSGFLQVDGSLDGSPLYRLLLCSTFWIGLWTAISTVNGKPLSSLLETHLGLVFAGAPVFTSSRVLHIRRSTSACLTSSVVLRSSVVSSFWMKIQVNCVAWLWLTLSLFSSVLPHAFVSFCLFYAKCISWRIKLNRTTYFEESFSFNTVHAT